MPLDAEASDEYGDSVDLVMWEVEDRRSFNMKLFTHVDRNVVTIGDNGARVHHGMEQEDPAGSECSYKINFENGLRTQTELLVVARIPRDRDGLRWKQWPGTPRRCWDGISCIPESSCQVH